MHSDYKTHRQRTVKVHIIIAKKKLVRARTNRFLIIDNW